MTVDSKDRAVIARESESYGETLVESKDRGGKRLESVPLILPYHSIMEGLVSG
jgi:hypothetical protein